MKDSNLYFIDTNIFLRILVKEDKKTFKECFEFVKKVREGKIKAFTSSLVLIEVGWVLGKTYKFSKKQVTDALKGILNLKELKIVDKYHPYLAVSIYEKFNVKFVDAFIASSFLVDKKKLGSVIVSYDRDFDKIGVKRKEPKDFL